ncbi:MAG: TldD/PmbA family protein [Rhizobiaceae bacterium]
MAEMIDLARLQKDAMRLVEAAQRAGADHCDVVVAHGQSVGMDVRDGKVENSRRAEADTFSLRVFCSNQVASVNTNTALELDALAERAVAMARVSPEDAYQGLAPAEDLAAGFPDLDLCDASVPEIDDLTKRALACEEAGLSVTGVSKSMGASAGWGLSGFVLATSHGFRGSYSVSRHSMSCAMVAGEGTSMERDYDYHSAVHGDDLEDPTRLGRNAGERAVRRIDPRQVDSATVPVLFDKRVASGLVAALAGAINGSSIARKTSFLRNMMGKAVANPRITLICDPLRQRGLASRPFDGEGMGHSAMRFVEKGILKDWVLDWATARELGLRSNGRATRSGSGTSPATTNLHLEPGTASLEDMIASIDKGLYLTETIGHGINMVTGDFSKGASGFWIENGKIAWPVAGITIAGNLKDMFATMEPANDLEFRGATNSPSLLVEAMTVGGK